MIPKPVLVLLHGHGVDATIWNDIHDAFSADYTTIRPDFSTLTTHNSIEAYAEHLFGLLQTAGVESCILIGHSMGGYIALAFAEQHPAMVAGLCLFHSTAFADDEPKRQQRQKTIQSLQESGTEPFIRATLPKMVGDIFREQQADQLQNMMQQYRQLPAEALTVGMQAIATRPDRTHVLREAGFPVLIIAGRQDQLIPLEKTQELFGLSPQIRSVVLNDAGHLGMVETPAEAIDALRQWV